MKRLRFVSFWIWKKAPAFKQLPQESWWGSGKNQSFQKFGLFFCKKSQLSPFRNWLHKETNKKCLPFGKFQNVTDFFSFWDRSMLTWSLRVVIFGKGSACCNSKSEFFVQLRSWNNRDARYVHDFWSSHGNLQVIMRSMICVKKLQNLDSTEIGWRFLPFHMVLSFCCPLGVGFRQGGHSQCRPGLRTVRKKSSINNASSFL